MDNAFPQIDFLPMPEDRFFRNALMVETVDGDTIDVVIDLGWSMTYKERLRIESVNTPETRGDEKKAGKFVEDIVRAELPKDTPLIIASTVYDRTGRARGRYGRTIAIVYRKQDGWCLNKHLLENRLAWPTDDNGSIMTERSLDLLTGIPPQHRA